MELISGMDVSTDDRDDCGNDNLTKFIIQTKMKLLTQPTHLDILKLLHRNG